MSLIMNEWVVTECSCLISSHEFSLTRFGGTHWYVVPTTALVRLRAWIQINHRLIRPLIMVHAVYFSIFVVPFRPPFFTSLSFRFHFARRIPFRSLSLPFCSLSLHFAPFRITSISYFSVTATKQGMQLSATRMLCILVSHGVTFVPPISFPVAKVYLIGWLMSWPRDSYSIWLVDYVVATR